jgi:hypothetical protein
MLFWHLHGKTVVALDTAPFNSVDRPHTTGRDIPGDCNLNASSVSVPSLASSWWPIASVCETLRSAGLLSVIAQQTMVVEGMISSRCHEYAKRLFTQACNFVAYKIFYWWLHLKQTIILPVVLYGCEIWSLTLREEHRLMVFENRMLRILGPKMGWGDGWMEKIA